MQCGKVIRGSQKLTCLVVFLKPPGLGKLGMIMELIWDGAARLGTLNSRIPKCSDVTYESRIWGLVTSSNTLNYVGYGLGWVAWLMSVMKWPRKGWG